MMQTPEWLINRVCHHSSTLSPNNVLTSIRGGVFELLRRIGVWSVEWAEVPRSS